MARGKQTCKILKEIRRQIAEANDIELVTSECRYKGDCLGTCPKCEAEVRYLEQQLRKRQLAGKLVNLAGISAGAIAMLTLLAVQSQTPDTSFTKDCVATQEIADTVIVTDTIIVKGVVHDGDTLKDGTISREPMVGAIIINSRTRSGTSTDIDGNFQIKVCKSDSLEISYIGYKKQSVIVLDDDAPLEIMLHSDDSLILGELAVAVGALSAPVDREDMLDLHIIDENKKTLTTDKNMPIFVVLNGEKYKSNLTVTVGKILTGYDWIQEIIKTDFPYLDEYGIERAFALREDRKQLFCYPPKGVVLIITTRNPYNKVEAVLNHAIPNLNIRPHNEKGNKLHQGTDARFPRTATTHN